MSLPGCAMIPAPYRERGQMAYETGRRIVEMAYEDLRPSKILSTRSFLNAIKLLTAIGGSTNAQPHLVAMARHAGFEITPDDWTLGLRPAADRQHAARRQVSRPSASTAPAASRGDRRDARGGRAGRRRNDRAPAGLWPRMSRARPTKDRDVIFPWDAPLMEKAGFLVLIGQSVRLGDHEDQRDLRRFPRALSLAARGRGRVRGRGRSCSTDRTIITTASTIPRWRSTRTASS